MEPSAKRSRKKKRLPSGKTRFLSRKRYLILLPLAVILIALLAVYLYVNSLFQQNSDAPSVNMEEMTNANLDEDTLKLLRENWTIAIFGLESENNTLGKGARSDTIMLCNINEKTGDIRLVSVYRDTYLKIGKSKYFKINSAYEAGGPEQAIRALNENLDLQIDNYIAVTWKAVADGINAIGGIDLDVTEKEFKYLNAFITHTVESTGVGSVHLKKAGPNHLDGVQAVAYCRLRLMDTDFKRTERQQKVISLALEKAKASDLTTLNNAVNIVLPQTVHEFEMKDLVYALKNISKYHLAKTGGFPFELTTQYVGKADCVIPQDLVSNVSELHHFLFDTEDYKPSAKVQEISQKIIADSKKSSAPAETTAPAETETVPGPSETLPGESETLPGESETLPGESEILPGESEILPGEPVATSGSPGNPEETESSGADSEGPAGEMGPGDAIEESPAPTTAPVPAESIPAESVPSPVIEEVGPGQQ